MSEARRILVIDDEPGMRAGLAEVLARSGFTVEVAATGEEGLARLALGGIDLLVTSTRLTGGSLAGRRVRDVERQLIFETLQRTKNNRTQAARLLGISIRTLRNKLAGYRQLGEQDPTAQPGV